jgi:hypothetical protein
LSVKKAIELCKKYAKATEYYDKIIEDRFVKMPFLAKKLVNDTAKKILEELERNPKCKDENSSKIS